MVGVQVKVGHLRQVVPDALEFAFELCAQGTAAEGATLELEEVPVAVVCRACGAESEPDGFPLACAACGASTWRSSGARSWWWTRSNWSARRRRSGG